MLSTQRHMLCSPHWNSAKLISNYLKTSFTACSRNSYSSESTQEGSVDNVEEDKVEEDIKKLNESLTELTEKYQRSLAETENVRMRLRKEINDAKLFGIQTFCKDLLTVADVMNLAVSSISPEKVVSESNDMWKSFYEGVCLTNNELHKVFEKHGLVLLKPKCGEKFDPNEHEALFEKPMDGMRPGMIAHVERVGYQLKGRTLRPAQVGITAKYSS